MIEQFKQAMQAAGIEPPAEILADGTLHRFTVPGDKARSDNGFYTLHPDGIPAGQFGCWKRGISETWSSKEYKTLTPEEKARYTAKIEAMKRQRDEERERIQSECRAWCADTWEKAKEATNESPYLKMKGVPSYGLKAFGDTLMVPLMDMAGVIHGIQFISADGSKKFKKDTNKAGHFYKIGKFKNKSVVVCEGYATGASLHQATGHCVVIAFDAGNLKTVTAAIRAKCPGYTIIIAADDDHATEGNPGLTKATEAAKTVNGKLAVPVFQDAATRGTDFNDLHQVEGLDAVRACIEAAMVVPALAEESPPERKPEDLAVNVADLVDRVFAAICWIIVGILPEGLAVLSGPPKIGKSWMAASICLAASFGGYVFGKFKVEQCESLLLSLEDNPRRLQGRVKKLLAGEKPNRNFSATTTWRRLDQGGLVDLKQWLAVHPACKLVIIDTIQKIKARPKQRGGNAYENDYEIYGDLQRLALEYHCCILLLHHNRKSDSKNEDDPLEGISGSMGITGVADTIIMLKRARGSSGATLTITGRDVPEATYALQFDSELCTWTVIDKVPDEMNFQEGSNSTKIVDAIRGLGGNATLKEIYEELGGTVKLETLKPAAYRLRGKGIISKLHDRFYIKNSDTSDTGDTGDTSDTSDTQALNGEKVSPGITGVFKSDTPQTSAGQGFTGNGITSITGITNSVNEPSLPVHIADSSEPNPFIPGGFQTIAEMRAALEKENAHEIVTFDFGAEVKL